jgi:FlaG/FlaF family flagellin (archaellin)
MSESAVSENISVILIVAMVVILAAFVIQFALGVAGYIPSARVIAVTAERIDDGHINVYYQGGPDQESLESLTVRWPSGTTDTESNPELGYEFASAVNPVDSGITKTSGHIVVTAYFDDQKEQVVLDTSL